MRRSAPVGRVLSALVTVVLVVVIVFGIVDTLVDPAAVALGQGAAPEEVARLRGAWGLDRPWMSRICEILGGLASFDLGVSRVQQVPVSRLIGRAFAPTLMYALPGMILATLVGIGGGLAAARRVGSALDRLLTGAAALVMSTSSLILVIVGHQLLAHRWGLFSLVGWPLAGAESEVSALVGLALLPALLWALVQVGPDLRHYRSIFVRELREPYLDGLRSRGIAEGRVLRHAVRGASAPILARIAGRLPHLVVGSLVIDQVFNIPGIGGLAITALRTGDLALVEGLAVVLASITITGQLLLDLAAAAIDPRVRAGNR